MTYNHARSIFATFSNELKTSMKQAALRNEWDGETWALQADLVGDALRYGRVTPEEMAEAYRTQPILEV
jgi:predicted RNA-binding protein associated with RNAse of E/G family